MIYVSIVLGRPLLSVLVFVASVLCVLALHAPIGRWLSRRRERAKRYAYRMHLEAPPWLWSYGGPVLGIGIFLLLTLVGAVVPGMAIGILVYLMVEFQPRMRLKTRAARFDKQLPEALTGLANSLRAGMALPGAVRQVAQDSPVPASQEFARMVDEYELGKPIEQAFEDAGGRLENNNFGLAVTAFRVGRERGGELASVFENIGESIREIYRVEEKIRTASTQGRSSARFMSAMPGIFLFLLWVMDAEGVSLLFSTGLGLIILTLVLIFNVIGHIWIRRILDIDV